MVMVFTTISSTPNTSFPMAEPTTSVPPRLRNYFTLSRKNECCCSNHNLKDHRTQNGQLLHCDERFRRRLVLFVSLTTSSFPSFIFICQDKGFEVKVATSESYDNVTWDLYRDFKVDKGDCPKAGQQVFLSLSSQGPLQVTLHYVGYNELGRQIDNTYLQGASARIRIGTNALVLGFEEGIRGMKARGKRRIIIVAELGPPVGPSTFFSSKQFEVFDVVLVSIQDCKRWTIGFFSDLYVNGNCRLFLQPK